MKKSNRFTEWMVAQWYENGWFSYVLPCLTAIASVICAFIFDTSGETDYTEFIVAAICIVLAVTAVLALARRKLSVQQILLVLFIVSFLLRLGYVLYTGGVQRQHDVGNFGAEDGIGHAAYIEWFYYNGLKLPEISSEGAFYHPPLHHMLAAIWMHFLTALGMSLERAEVSIQFLTLFYASCCSIVTERILHALDVHGGGKIAAFAIVAFHPTFTLLSGSINNDILATLFILLAVYATIRWYQEPTLKRIMLIALSIGFGMMTKLTAAMVAIPVALIFVVKLWQAKEWRARCIGQFTAFLAVCCPLGLWHPIWKLVRFQLPLDYVPLISSESDQYIGNHAAWERFLDFSGNPFQNIYLNRPVIGDAYAEFNLIVATLKTSVFGEYKLAWGGIVVDLSKGLFAANVLLIGLSLCAMIYCLCRKSRVFDKWLKVFLMFYWGFLIAYFIKFCFDYPHTCSMDFRYIVPCCVIGAVFIGMMWNRLEERKQAHHLLTVSVQALIAADTAAFCALSTAVYILLGTL